MVLCHDKALLGKRGRELSRHQVHEVSTVQSFRLPSKTVILVLAKRAANATECHG